MVVLRRFFCFNLFCFKIFLFSNTVLYGCCMVEFEKRPVPAGQVPPQYLNPKKALILRGIFLKGIWVNDSKPIDIFKIS